MSDIADAMPPVPSSALVAKLRLFAPLSEEDAATLEAISRKVRRIGPREDIVREGAAPGHVHLILSGWACRYKQLANGRRQILSLLLPGDMSDLLDFVLAQIDHSVASITAVTLAEVPHESMLALTSGGAPLSRALWSSALVGQSIEREWIVSLGQRSAVERLAHLFCELFVRLRAVGLTRGDECDLPLTQLELAEASGLSTVHVNRSLQELRGQGLIVVQGKTLVVPDLRRLQKLAHFNEAYLHMSHAPSRGRGPSPETPSGDGRDLEASTAHAARVTANDIAARDGSL